MGYFVYRNDRDGGKYFCGVIEDEEQAKEYCRAIVDGGAKSAYLKQLGNHGAVFFYESPHDYCKWSIPLNRHDPD